MVTSKSFTAFLLATTAGAAFAQDFPWRTDAKLAFAEAKAQKKPVMIYFTTSWCGWCKIMEQQTFSKPAVIKQAQSYIPLKLDAEKEGKTLAAKYKVNAYPHFIFVNPDGTTKGSVLGFQDETGFLEKVKVIFLLKDERERLKSILTKKTSDAIANCSMAMLLIEEGQLAEAERHLKVVRQTGYQGADLAAGLSQLAQAVAGSDPKHALELYQASVKLKDRNTVSITYERIMQLGAETGNLRLMETTAEAILKAEHISPELKSKSEKLLKGNRQQSKLATPESLLQELQFQFSAQSDRDQFFFKNLFLDGAGFTALYRQQGQTWQWVVDQSTYLDTFKVDKLSTKFILVEPSMTKGRDLAFVDAKFRSSSIDDKGDVIEGAGRVMLILVQQGGRWYVQSYCQEVDS